MVHAVLAGITKLLMLAIWLTKLYLVNLSPLRRAFSFCNTIVKHSSLNLGVLIDTRGGNRYQGCLLILTSGLPSKLGLTMFHHVPTLFHLVFPLFFRKSLIYLVCSYVPPRKRGDTEGKF